MAIKLDTEVDKKAVEILLKAPLMSKDELDITINNLRQMAAKKSGKRNIRYVMDLWADKAYSISMKC
ncbi:conserved hypothetical protein [Methanococcus vannielii SB]|uniref:Uncharacterized protein n=1 Tax=Methanococcus vannielii (strain ATCC 35089 / DSM 1224 / JCM 13029 / OCM 148 / SB) TaxID=406327 RepID=A6USG7_METVS|nr:hypothetical protein [Methanococcus vannielii]ABR55439.1 conserved hypothetical protein [Methanococcus vannielii SB]